MAEKLNFSAFNTVDEIMGATATGKVIQCGWIPFDARTVQQIKAATEASASLTNFTIRGRFTASQRRYSLWRATVALTGKFPRFNWQQTGSCVGAGGDNALKVLMGVEIAAKGEHEQLLDVWWPFAYGRSRYYAGIKGPGEGSCGSTWAKAIITDGFFEIDPADLPDLPNFIVKDNWLIQTAAVEMQWSNGGAIPQKWIDKGRTHLVKSMARMKNKHDCYEAIANGYPLTQASSFGFSSTKVKGTQYPIRVAEWNGTWNHQTYLDESWDHPEIGGIFYRWGNNWGPDAHGKPTGDEPPGGVYIHENTLDQICKSGEVYAMSAADGFPAQELNFAAF